MKKLNFSIIIFLITLLSSCGGFIRVSYTLLIDGDNSSQVTVKYVDSPFDKNGLEKERLKTKTKTVDLPYQLFFSIAGRNENIHSEIKSLPLDITYKEGQNIEALIICESDKNYQGVDLSKINDIPTFISDNKDKKKENYYTSSSVGNKLSLKYPSPFIDK